MDAKHFEAALKIYLDSLVPAKIPPKHRSILSWLYWAVLFRICADVPSSVLKQYCYIASILSDYRLNLVPTHDIWHLFLINCFLLLISSIYFKLHFSFPCNCWLCFLLGQLWFYSWFYCRIFFGFPMWNFACWQDYGDVTGYYSPGESHTQCVNEFTSLAKSYKKILRA